MKSLNLDELRQLTSDSKVLSGDEFLISDVVKVFFVSIKTNFGSGKKTVYSYKINGSEEKSNKDITTLSNDIVKEGARLNVEITYTKREYKGHEKTTKVLSAEELEERIADKTQKMCAPFVKYVGDSSGNIDCDKVHEMYLTIENSIRSLCECIETAENEQRREKRAKEVADKTAKALGNDEDIDSIDIMIAALKRKKEFLEAAKAISEE